jgi:hypothetical protein
MDRHWRFCDPSSLTQKRSFSVIGLDEIKWEVGGYR